MKAPFILILLPFLFAGCVSKPVANFRTTAEVKNVGPDSPLVVGECLVLESKDGLVVQPWRRTIDAEGYFSAPLNQRVKIAGKTLTEASDLIAAQYVRTLGPPRLVLMRCEEYDRKKLEIERRIKQAEVNK